MKHKLVGRGFWILIKLQNRKISNLYFPGESNIKWLSAEVENSEVQKILFKRYSGKL